LIIGSYEVTASKWQIPKTGTLITQLRENTDAGARQRAAWWLGEHEAVNAVSALVEALGDESADVRLASAWALGEIKDEDTIAPLTRSLEGDGDALVREMAALALGEIEHSSAIDPLVKAFEDDEQVRLAVVWALGEIAGRGNNEAERVREKAFAELGRPPHENEQVWSGTLRDDPSATDGISGLLDELRSDDSVVRRDAALKLGLMGVRHEYDSTVETEAVVGALLITLRDSVPEVRAAAVWSLDEVNPSRSARGR
jgi:HEAT repeat protein